MMAGESKYRPKYAKALEQGMCKDGTSIEKCCREWKITRVTYNAWIEKYPRFAKAAELAKLDRAIWWQDLNMKVASGDAKGNAGLIQFALKNIEGINWADKVEVNNHFDEEVKTINIKMLAPNNMQFLEHDDDSILDAEIIHDERS